MNVIKIANHTYYVDDVYIEDGAIKALVFDIDSHPKTESCELYITSVKEAEYYLAKNYYYSYDIKHAHFEENFSTADYLTFFRDAFITAIIDQYPGVKKNVVTKWRFLLASLVTLHIICVCLLVKMHYIAAPVLYLVCMLWLSRYASKNRLL